MKKLSLIIAFSICSVVGFSQELKNPTMKAPFAENSGNFLVLTPFDKIGKSEITIDFVRSLRQELTDAQKLISDHQKLINDQKKESNEHQKLINEQKKGIDELKNLVSTLQKQLDEQKRKIEELQRKVK